MKILVILLLTMVTNIVMAATLSPVGFWQTIDDVTAKPRALVMISSHHGQLTGKIVKLYLQAGEKNSDVCKKCQGERHNQPIVGLDIMWGLTKHDDYWGGGRILDPASGKIYRSKISLADHGKKLKVRGYIGIPLFGRTQTWVKLMPKRHKNHRHLKLVA